MKDDGMEVKVDGGQRKGEEGSKGSEDGINERERIEDDEWEMTERPEIWMEKKEKRVIVSDACRKEKRTVDVRPQVVSPSPFSFAHLLSGDGS